MTASLATRALGAVLFVAAIGAPVGRAAPTQMAAADDAAGGAAGGGAAGPDDTTPRQATLTIKVVEGEGAPHPGAPIPEARVVVTLPDGKEVWGITKSDGSIPFDGVAYGALTVQVLKTSWQTAGSAFNIASPTKTLEFKLKPDVPPAP